MQPDTLHDRLKAELDRRLAVARAATPGPWSADPTGTVCADSDLAVPPGGETRQEWRLWVEAHAPFDRLDGDPVTPATASKHIERRRAAGYPDPGKVQTRTVHEGPWVAVSET